MVNGLIDVAVQSAAESTASKDLNAYKQEVDEFKELIDNNLSLIGVTKVGSNYIYSPKIAGGYAYFTKGNYSVEIDPSHSAGNNTLNGYLFAIRDKSKSNSEQIIMGVDTSGNGTFSGKIVADSGNIGGWDIGTGENSGWLINYGTTSAYGDCGIYWENTDYYAILNQSNWEMGANDACLFRLNVNNPNYIGHGSDDSNDNRLYCNLGYINMTSKGYIDINSSNSINFNSSNSINFNNLTKFYKGIRIQASLSDYVELSTTVYDSSAANAYLVNNGSMKIG